MPRVAPFLKTRKEPEFNINSPVKSQGSGNFHRRTFLIELDLVREASERCRGRHRLRHKKPWVRILFSILNYSFLVPAPSTQHCVGWLLPSIADHCKSKFRSSPFSSRCLAR